MLALVFTVLLVVLGDTITRPFLRHETTIHRLSAAILVGLLATTWLTYLVALALSGAFSQPLYPADAIVLTLLALVTAGRLLGWWRAREQGRDAGGVPGRSRTAGAGWDWIVLGGLGIGVAWMMTGTFGFAQGEVLIGIHEWGDVGPTMTIAQSFAVGHNYPTQYPLFAGPSILYHFLFYFQVGNLTFLGLDPAAANSLLAAGTTVAMLGLVMTLGRRLFGSALVGRIAAALFFFHGSLAFVRFLGSFASPGEALTGVLGLDHYLPSGLPFVGEDWATWSLNPFLNQRHLASAIGIVLVVVLFVVDRMSGQAPEAIADRSSGLLSISSTRLRSVLRDPSTRGYLVCGLLLGMLPLWNGLIYVASAALLAVVFLLGPNRVQLGVLAVAAALLSIPQLLYLRQPGLSSIATHYPVFHLGYTVDPLTFGNLAAFLGTDFGPKLILVAVAMLSATLVQRRMLAAASALVVLGLSVQLTVDIVNNHKLFSAWLIIVNVFAAAGLVRLWQPEVARPGSAWLWRAGLLLRRLAAVGLAGVIVVGGVIDLMPLGKDPRIGYALAGDRLYDWVVQETQPTDIFLTDVYVVHPILLAGRPVYFGWPVYAWSAGYDVEARKAIYQRMLQGRDGAEVVALLRQEHIAYVAIDDNLRKSTGDFIRQLNEDVLKERLEAVFTDPLGRYAHLVIYRVPTGAPVAGSVSGAAVPSGARLRAA